MLEKQKWTKEKYFSFDVKLCELHTSHCEDGTSKQKEICTRWEMLVSFLDNKCIFAYLIFSGSKMAICISLIFCGAKSVGAGMRSLYSGDRVVDRPGSIYTPVAKCRILKRNLEDFFPDTTAAVCVQGVPLLYSRQSLVWSMQSKWKSPRGV